MILKKSTFYAYLYTLLGLLFVYFVNPYYVCGDQEHYYNLW